MGTSSRISGTANRSEYVLVNHWDESLETLSQAEKVHPQHGLFDGLPPPAPLVKSVERPLRRNVRNGSVVCRGSENVSLDQSNYCVTRATNNCGIFRDRVHHWLDFCRRTRDDLKNLTGGGLLLQ